MFAVILENKLSPSPIRVLGVYRTEEIADENAAALACCGCTVKCIGKDTNICPPDAEMSYIKEKKEWRLWKERLWVQEVY